MNADDYYLPPKAAADVAGVDDSVIYKWIQKKKLTRREDGTVSVKEALQLRASQRTGRPPKRKPLVQEERASRHDLLQTRLAVRFNDGRNGLLRLFNVIQEVAYEWGHSGKDPLTFGSDLYNALKRAEEALLDGIRRRKSELNTWDTALGMLGSGYGGVAPPGSIQERIFDANPNTEEAEIELLKKLEQEGFDVKHRIASLESKIRIRDRKKGAL
jgi:hypothetical protein